MKKLLFLLIVALLSSCEYFTLLSKKEWSDKSGNEDDVIIFASGAWYDLSISNYRACYWKIKENNIERVDLESNNTFSTAYSIFVDGDNIYTCGFDTIGANTKACYWINEEIYYLDELNNGLSSMAYNLSSKDGIVYTVGVLNGTACYWKNNNKKDLNINTVFTIFINQVSSGKHDLYFAGKNLNIPSQACYIKDQKIIDLSPLPSGVESSEVRSMYVAGNKIYSVGQLILDIPPVTYYACLWKNNDLTILPNGTLARSVFISGEDIYISGDFDSGADIYPRYWINNKSFTLPNSNLGAGTNSFAYSIFVLNDIIYIGGLDDDGGGNSLAWYWTNGEKIVFDPSLNAGITSIFVKQNTEN